tara:strand:- start:2461 stop:3675 length:1215 start_codon:yes stop_codon:yes gene_type:complete
VPNPGVDKHEAEKRLETIEEFLVQGYCPAGVTPPPGQFGALRMAVQKYGKSVGSSGAFLISAERTAGRAVDWSLWKQPIEAKFSAPGGQFIKGTSTLVQSEHGPQWIKTDTKKAHQFEMMVQAVESAINNIEVRKRIQAPKVEEKDLLLGIPVGDQHIGMYAWGEETLGEEWTTKKSADLLCSAFEYLIDQAPSADTCLIAIMGDYFHYDSMASVTPQHRNQLDSDVRYKQMTEAGINALTHCIDLALGKFKTIRVILEKGNHDPIGILWLQSLISRLYKDNPRVTTDESPAHFHYYQFGATLIGTHHGDGKAAKFAELPDIMAHDCADIWSSTRHRYWWTGHVHNKKIEDKRTCQIESLRVLAPGDSYSSSQGYRARRDLQAIVFHREFGERWRYNVTPEMLA